MIVVARFTSAKQVGNLSEHARAKWATQLRGIHATRAYKNPQLFKYCQMLVQNKWLFYVENGHDLNKSYSIF
jgi:hypothetical protein